MPNDRDIRKVIGSRLRALREARMRVDPTWTQERVARELNVSLALVSAYERGERSTSLDNLDMFADLFGVTTDYLMGRTDKPTPVANDRVDAPVPVYGANFPIPSKRMAELDDDARRKAEEELKAFEDYLYQKYAPKKRPKDAGSKGSGGED